ncbi:Uncharacterized protein GBIM_10431 [Gryllus bimaculatus]|nr:Uncharacterized protein GBIM_10431 [Gryllus bimaculatus]
MHHGRLSFAAGDLLLEGFEEEEVILACALPADWASPRRLGLLGGPPYGAGPVPGLGPEAPTAEAAEAAGLRLLEMDADARFLVARALPSADAERRLFHTPLLRAALALCRERGDAWRCQVKVTHHICPRVEPAPLPAPIPPPPDAPLPPTPPSGGGKGGSRDSSGRLQRSLAKLRFPTKKSSSFTYTASVRPEPSPSPALAPAPAPPPRNLPGAPSRAWGGGSSGGGGGLIVSGGVPALVAPLADEVPYSHALDALPGARGAPRGADENLYAEICDAPPRPPPKGKLESFYHLKVRSVERTKEDCYYVQLDDGRYAGTLCSRAASEGDYDTVC